jgi:hypothetical protein
MVIIAPARRRLGGVLARVLIALAGAALVVIGLIAVGSMAREGLSPQERYLIPFAEIDSPAPPGQTLGDFLAEVRYLSEMPERISLLDTELADKLGAAFARHPKVERVVAVSVTPPRHVHVELQFRGK